MVTIKSYTDLKQSKKLSGILSSESADMWYHGHYSPWESEREYDKEPCPFHSKWPNWDMSCWSLSALLNVLPNTISRYYKTLGWCDNNWNCAYMDDDGKIKDNSTADNPVDACYNMILKIMNNPQNFLKEALKELEKHFIGIKLKYAYDTLTEYHIIEVKPEEIRRGNADYKKAEIQLWMDFNKQFPDEDLLICAPSDANDMTNVLFETE